MNAEHKQGLLQALGVTLYCSLIGLVLFNGEKLFGQMNSLIGPITFLLMFSVSAMICGLMVFYKPYQLFLDDKKEKAASVVLSTVAYLFAILLILFVLMVLTSQKYFNS